MVGSGRAALVADAVGSAGVALAAGVSALLVEAEALPLIAAANAVTCVRTSWSFVRAASSSDTAAALLLPVVPVGAAAPVALSAPSRSFRMRSIAATSVAQLEAARADGFAASAGAWLSAARLSSVDRRRFDSGDAGRRGARQ